MDGPGSDTTLFVTDSVPLVDNTNADPETRAIWVDLAKKYKVPARCVWFKTPSQICEHNDAVRALNKSVRTPR
ncbi:AAA family ATPase, partial [Candidatus Bathyarchaeota archaeon]|nr:AAA family ATPase [Candidatus Bathyarchaeota archaeon]